MKLKKGDIIVAAILIAAAISWLVLSQRGNNNESREAVVQVNGKPYRVISIQSSMAPQRLHIALDSQKYIDIVVDREGAYVADVICPDKLCQKTGRISRPGRSIVCLPNKVVVYIEGTEKPEVDQVSY